MVGGGVMLLLFLNTTFEFDFVFCFEFDAMFAGVTLIVFLFAFLRIVGIFFLYGDFVEGRLPVLSLLFITKFGRY